MRSKSSLLINSACLFIPVVFFHLCLRNIETRYFGERFIWPILIVVFVLLRYWLVNVFLLAVFAALFASKRLRLPRKLVQAGLCLAVGYIVGVMWFISHMQGDLLPIPSATAVAKPYTTPA